MLKLLLRKIVCIHDWEIIHVAHYVDAADRVLLVCGKITKKRV